LDEGDVREMKRWHVFLAAAVLGYLIGRLVPPAAPHHWSGIYEGMTFENVYQKVPELRGSMREIKGFDITRAHTGSRFWELQVYYDEAGKVSKVEREFVWGW
jgi:hypothetical protein